MSLAGARVGVISLGMCCQSTFQIRQQAKLVADLCGDPTMTRSGMPFDGIICPPASAALILKTNRFRPDHIDELTIPNTAHWREVNAYFWHEFKSRKRDRVFRAGDERHFRRLAEKYDYMAGKFRRLGTLERLVFMISNSQNNLPKVAEMTGTIDPVMDLQSIDALAAAGDAFFQRRCEYVVVGYEKWLRGRCERDNVSVFALAPDDSEWQGDPLQWEQVFRAVLPRRSSVRVAA